MITVLIVQDEEKIKDILIKLLKQEGYAIPSEWQKDSIIKIIKKDGIKDIGSLKEKIIELEDSLYNEKKGLLYKSILDIIEKPLIEHMLEHTDGNQLKAAKILGMNRNTIRAKIKRLGINVREWKT